VVQNLKGKVTQGLLGPLDQLAGVRFGEGNAQILSSRFPERLGARVEDLTVVCFASKGVKVADETSNILVSDIRFEAELVLESHGICEDEVHGSTDSLVSHLMHWMSNKKLDPHTPYGEDPPCRLHLHAHRY
jgi:hypothetical protein